MFDSIGLKQLVDAYALPWAINIGLALLILVLGRWLVAVAVRIARALMERAKLEPMLIHFIGSILTGLLILAVVIAAIAQLGVDTTSLIALIGAAGLAIGLALQKSLSNFASGLMLVTFKPFKVGDYVEAAGTGGVVSEIRIFSTMMITPDNRLVIVPNGAIYENTIVNYSALDTRRIDLVFAVSYADDIKLAQNILEGLIAEDARILSDPAPVVRVRELGDSAVNFDVRPWVNKDDYWVVRSDLMEKVKLAFDAGGITVPFPQRDVRLYHEVTQ